MRGMTPLLAARLQFYEFARMLHYKQASVHAQFDDHLRAFRKRCELKQQSAEWQVVKSSHSINMSFEDRMAWWANLSASRPTRARLGKNGTRMRNHTRGKNRTKDQNRTRKKKHARNATDRARKRKGDVRDGTAERRPGRAKTAKRAPRSIGIDDVRTRGR